MGPAQALKKYLGAAKKRSTSVAASPTAGCGPMATSAHKLPTTYPQIRRLQYPRNRTILCPQRAQPLHVVARVKNPSTTPARSSTLFDRFFCSPLLRALPCKGPVPTRLLGVGSLKLGPSAAPAVPGFSVPDEFSQGMAQASPSLICHAFAARPSGGRRFCATHGPIHGAPRCQTHGRTAGT